MKYRIREICRKKRVSYIRLLRDAEIGLRQFLELAAGICSVDTLVRLANSLDVEVVDLIEE